MVLNPQLKYRLESLFGACRVVNPGQALIGRTISNPVTGCLQFVTRLPGEYYAVSCPFCNDSRKRLLVSYRFGQREGGEYDRFMNFLAHCYNETLCMTDRQNRDNLVEMLESNYLPLDRLRVKPGKKSARLTTVMPPGKITLLKDLPDTHRARSYVEGRGFDCLRLSNFWDVGYVQRSHESMAAHRIYVPFYFQGKYVGWQGRLPEDLPKTCKWPPKYMTCPGMSKQFMLFNYDNAVKWRTGVVVEGTFDVFGFGPPAMAVLGSSISDFQQRLLVESFETVVILLDPREIDTPRTKATLEAMRQRMGKNRVAAVKLPSGSDPGSLDRHWARDYVQDRAAKQKVKVYYEMKEKP